MLGRNLIEQLYKKYNRRYSSFLIIPFSEVADKPLKFYQWYAFEFERELNCSAFADTYNKQIVIYKGAIMNNFSITIEIPYGKRDTYIDAIYDINSLIDSNGCCALFVSNIPYNLKSYLCIEGKSDNLPKIEHIIKSNHLEKITKFGFRELFIEMGNRQYNMYIIPTNIPKSIFARSFQAQYQFAAESELEDRGYKFHTHSERKKVFISYCHANKEIVYEITEALENSGINLWIDKKDMGVGTNILRSILNGINESDFAILFLSKATINSNYGQLELENIMAAMVMKKMNWYVVKIDDVNVEEIMPSLSNYKYFDLTQSNIDELTYDIVNHIRKIN